MLFMVYILAILLMYRQFNLDYELIQIQRKVIVAFLYLRNAMIFFKKEYFFIKRIFLRFDIILFFLFQYYFKTQIKLKINIEVRGLK